MSELPKWTGLCFRDKEPNPCTKCRNSAPKLYEALAIAWEMLGAIDQTCTCRDSGGRGCEGCQVGDAMRRISELGK